MSDDKPRGRLGLYEKGFPVERWLAVLEVKAYGNTEQEALDNLLLGYLSILDTDGRAHAVRFAQALCGAIEAGRCHE